MSRCHGHLWIALGILLLGLAACGHGGAEEATGEQPVAVTDDGTSLHAPQPTPAENDDPDRLPFGLRRCGHDDLLPADPSYYREQPVYVANEQPTEELRAWAAAKPGFEELWLDRDHNGWIALGFTEGAAERQAELEAAFPDVGVVAVEVPYGNTELEALRDEVIAALRADGLAFSGGHSVPRGRVGVTVGILDERHLAPLAPFADRPLCVDGVDPEAAIADGDQPLDGDGWRLLAVERTGPTYRTGLATTPEQYEAVWNTSGVAGPPPPVDFTDEVVVWFGAVYGSGCELRMDDVAVDLDLALVHPVFVVPGNPTFCASDANPEAYVVALRRGLLPTGPFMIQLGSDEPPQGAPEERTLVEADLTRPGSVALDEQIGFDPALTDRVDRGYVIASGGFVEPGFPAGYWLALDCTFDVIGPINDVLWQSVAGDIDADPDPGWVAAAEADGRVFTQLLLAVEPPRLSMSAADHTEHYVPARGDIVTDCD